MQTPRSTKRIPELDALHGIAAVVVLVFHWLAVIPIWNRSGTPTRVTPAARTRC